MLNISFAQKKMNYILHDGVYHEQLKPLTFMRPVADLRIGIITLKQKWQHLLSADLSYLTQDYLANKYPLHVEPLNVVINGALLANPFLCDAIASLNVNQQLLWNDVVLATGASKNELDDNTFLKNPKEKLHVNDAIVLERCWHFFTHNASAIQADFEMLTTGRKSQNIYAPNKLVGLENIFIEEGAEVMVSILNGNTGPIYIGKNAVVMEGCMIRGPFVLGDNAHLKMGAKIYGATTIGDFCKVGGEVNNSILMANSNKAHDGYLGNAVIGQWCNLGADSNCSNLKNNYGTVKVYDYVSKKDIDTGLQFCGLTMGDHSKCAINTQFNTGTVVGMAANIVANGFPPKHLPSFTWGSTDTGEFFIIDKAIALAQRVYQRRGLNFDESEAAIMHHVYRNTVAP